MKVQSLAVIFAIIILPIIIILSYYIHREVDTIATQTAYDTKLIDATHDAMAAFELNTANEDLSSVADALRSIIEASTNVFFNSLATNLGMSNANKDFVRPYVPAILYTLYDGYYIYAPTRVPEVLVGKDENDGDKLVYIGDYGVTYNGENSYGIGTYSFDEALFRTANTEDEGTKSARQTSLYNSLTHKGEFGQLLYKNNDGTYSPALSEDTFYAQDYVLKSYMPYSARYTGSKDSVNYDLTINYTLDNYMSVMGTIGDVYYSKTGYLIGKDVITSTNVDGISDILSYNEIEAEEICLSGTRSLSITINPFTEDKETRLTDIGSSPITYTYDAAEAGGMSYVEQKERLTKLYDDIENFYTEYRNTEDTAVIALEGGGTQTGAERKAILSGWIRATNIEIQNIESRIENLTAIAYYIKAQIFSNWVYSNLGNDGSSALQIRENQISDDYVTDNNGNYTSDLSDGDVTFHHDFSASNNIIFDVAQNPENLSSTFVSHKSDVTRNSVQYNLNLALSGYDIMAGEMDIKMPILSDAEWEKVLQNVSIVTFMQGFNCGLKYYNNYAIVSSTNNELTVIPNEIYYTKREEYNTGDLADINPLYHRVDCPEMLDNPSDTDIASDDYISFRSKEVKYDKIYNKDSGRYKYDHKNFACYNCIVGSNYAKQVRDEDGNIATGYNDDIVISAMGPNRQKIYYRAVAKAREMIYKTNALTDSNGFETLYTDLLGDDSTLTPGAVAWDNLPIGSGSTRTLSEVKGIEVSVKNIRSTDVEDVTVTFTATVNHHPVVDESGNAVMLTINFQDTSQTMYIPVHMTSTDKINSVGLNKISPDQDVEGNVLNVRVIYE